ncbi:MAG: DnaB-like helicase C-terminal domain-containing protein [Geobacteraceae bacterium]|nr:DnaB-like helicase C-terminal domain-containing protein [Geobacteraceae bacterium]
MQIFDDPTRQNSLCNTIYRYKGQPIHALHEFIDKSYEAMRQLNSNKNWVTGYPTGFIDLDHILSGLQPGSLIVLASRPSMGKSALALNILQNLSLNNTIPTAIFSLELSKEQLGIRLLTATARVDIGRIRAGQLTKAYLLKLDDAKELLLRSCIYIDDTSGISITGLLAKVIRLKVDYNVQVIVIDCLQLMRTDSRSALDQDELSRISSSLKVLARELGISVILLSQLPSSVDKRKFRQNQPRLSDLWHTGSLEDDADVILFLYREEVYCKSCRRRDGSCVHNHKHDAEIIIAKNKNGPTGSVFLKFSGDTMRFSDMC